MADAVMARPRGDVGMSLCRGDFCTAMYKYDHVWHVRMMLWRPGDKWEVVTPDDNRYLGPMAPGQAGLMRTVKLPASGEILDHITEAVYRFSRYLPLEARRDLLRGSFERARAADGDNVHLFGALKDVLGNEVSATPVVGLLVFPGE